jgi:hypothetical protein
MPVDSPTRDRYFVNTKVKKIAVFIFDPLVEGIPLSQFMEWNDPHELLGKYCEDMYEASRRTYKYDIVHLQTISDVTTLADGFKYDTKTLRKVMAGLEKPHEPMMMDYEGFVREHMVLENIRDRDWDEVWIMAYPYAGLWESAMGGPKAFWCNSAPMRNTETSEHRFVIMGFNYERGVGEMLEAFLHRAESIMFEVYRYHPPRLNMWTKFTKVDKDNPGDAAIGTCHFAPNSIRDYDWGNRTKVHSTCRDWEYNYPHLTGAFEVVDCSHWGNGDIRLHHLWWLKHLPHWPRVTNGVFNNWWHYIMTPDWVKV